MTKIVKICPMSIIEKSIYEGKSIRKVARELSVSEGCIWRRIAKYNLTNLINENRGKYKYSYLNIDLIRQLYVDKGKSTRNISDILNVNLSIIKTIVRKLGIVRHDTQYKGKPKNVRCGICGRNYIQLNWNHLLKHGLTPEEYSKKFPNTPLSSRKGKTFEEFYGEKEGMNKRMLNRKRVLEEIQFIYTDTKEQLLLKKILEELGFHIDKETCFGGFFIDCYAPEIHLGFEADGAWHNKKSDERRDYFLLTMCQLPLLRFTNDEINSKENKEHLKQQILEFVNLWEVSSKTRKAVGDEFLFDYQLTPSLGSFGAWKKGKIRKFDEDTKLYYWTVPENVKLICPSCGKVFECREDYQTLTCSNECARKMTSIGLSENWKERRGGISIGEVGYITSGNKLLEVSGTKQLWQTNSEKYRVYLDNKLILKAVYDYDKAKKVFDNPELANEIKGDCWNKGLTGETDSRVAGVAQKISEAHKNGSYIDSMIRLSEIHRIKLPQQRCPICNHLRVNIGDREDKYVCSNEVCSEFYFKDSGKTEIEKTEVDKLYEKVSPIIATVKRDKNDCGKLFDNKKVILYINRKNKYEVFRVVNGRNVAYSRNIIDLFDACNATILAQNITIAE